MDAIVLSRKRKRKAKAVAILQFVRHKAKSVIYGGNDALAPWRVVTGAVALERVRGNEVVLAGLALPGDIIGLEGILSDLRQDGPELRARAIVPSELMRWPASADIPWGGEEMMRNLLAQHLRNAELLSLRSGSAQERILKLVRLLGADAAGSAGVALPTLRDMAFITCIASESICRELKRLHDEGRVTYEGRRVSMRARMH